MTSGSAALEDNLNKHFISKRGPTSASSTSLCDLVKVWCLKTWMEKIKAISVSIGGLSFRFTLTPHETNKYLKYFYFIVIVSE